ncbi:hypothetical protein [Microlunatus flavus]|uniref:Uncharacterized protein n=1 Tax=Microlunatus flavus TaxID=1036181 RepID=A0A1H9A141_9ACTN|nr:hypothetical protein [Microlunatus flavus]SEP70364.1 hypothetical protein SAMN05421756_101436 [Microlunatus flavus]
MIVTVLGASHLGELPGLPAGDDTALLRVVGQGPVPGHVLVLTPTHGLVAAREQAHVLVAAHPQVKVCVLPLPHHALTLTLIAYELLSGPGTDGDPTALLLQVRRSAEASRSVLWYPRLRGLDEPQPTLRQGLTDLVRRNGWFRELGGDAADAVVTSGRTGSPFDATDTVHHLAGAPALMTEQLGAARSIEVPVEVERAPYWARSTTELTVLRVAPRPTEALRPCRDCGAGMLDGQCPFCGQGPVPPPEVRPPAGYLASAAPARATEPAADERPFAHATAGAAGPAGADGADLVPGEPS